MPAEVETLDTSLNLSDALARARDVVAGVLQPPAEPSRLEQAMAHALRGGKCLRGFLVLETARLHGISARTAAPVAAAIECIHAYSLVHDDLPAMDDDDLRRGQPTVHRAFDEATAILAGDALQARAFELVAGEETIAASRRVELVATLAQASGMAGMVGGQMMDIAAEAAERPLTLPEIERLQAGKTGALLVWSAEAGARMAGADTAPLAAYGRALGLAFQIADDILDIEGDAEEVGKAVGKDAGRGKATFVSLLGPDGAKARAATLVEDAIAALAAVPGETGMLADLARYVVTRRS